MIEKERHHRLIVPWPIIVVSGIIISTAFVVDWIGLSEPRDFSTSQILLIVVGLLILVIGILGRKIFSLYKSAAIILLNTLIVLLCLELGAAVALTVINRVFSGPPRPAERLAGYLELPYYAAQDWGTEYWLEFSEYDDHIAYSPWIVWRRPPFNGKTINTDQTGLRQTPGTECGPESYMVFVFGGSTMWGFGAPDWGTVTAYLQQGLASQKEEPICVVNFAGKGFVSTQGLIALITQLQTGSVPDMVIFYDGVNDVGTAYQSGKAGVHVNLSSVADRFEGRTTTSYPLLTWLRRSYTFSLLRRTFPEQPIPQENLITYKTLGVKTGDLADEVAQVYVANYTIVESLARRYDFEYHFFWQPVVSIGEKPLTDQEQTMKSEMDPVLIDLYDAVFNNIEKSAQEYKNLHYIADVFDDHDMFIWIDFVHVTPEGNQLIAKRMLDVFENSSLILK